MTSRFFEENKGCGVKYRLLMANNSWLITIFLTNVQYFLSLVSTVLCKNSDVKIALIFVFMSWAKRKVLFQFCKFWCMNLEMSKHLNLFNFGVRNWVYDPKVIRLYRGSQGALTLCTRGLNGFYRTLPTRCIKTIQRALLSWIADITNSMKYHCHLRCCL